MTDYARVSSVVLIVSLVGSPFSSEEQKQADGQELIDFCAECLLRFIQDHYGDENGDFDLEEPLSLGFTFSYPCMSVGAQLFISRFDLTRYS